MNSNRFWVLKYVGWLLVIFVLLALIVLPLLTTLLVSSGQMPSNVSKLLIAIEKIQVVTMQIFTVVWVFFLGGCFASFLNVVAWRVPRGRTVLGSSHCPNCNVKLKFLDNLPVYGWVRNGGKCSNCKNPISPRYLIAEILLGSVFVLLAATELASGGANLPFRQVSHTGFTEILFAPKWALIRIVAYHLVLVSSLFTFGLIEGERFRIPRSVLGFCLCFGIVLPLLWPQMHIVGWNSGYLQGSQADWPLVLTMLLGLLTGLGLGFVLPKVDFGLAGFQLKREPNPTKGSHETLFEKLSNNEVRLETALEIERVVGSEFVADEDSTDENEFSECENGTSVTGESEFQEPIPSSSDKTIDRPKENSEFPIVEPYDSPTVQWNVTCGITLIGLFLGWQSAISVAIIFLALNLILSLLTNSTNLHTFTSLSLLYNNNAKLLLASLVHILSWRWQSVIPFGLNQQAPWWPLVTGTVLLLLLLSIHKFCFEKTSAAKIAN